MQDKEPLYIEGQKIPPSSLISHGGLQKMVMRPLLWEGHSGTPFLVTRQRTGT